jgi:hypothetical protein
MAIDVTWVPVAGAWVKQSRPGVGAAEPATYDAR